MLYKRNICFPPYGLQMSGRKGNDMGQYSVLNGQNVDT